MAPFTKRTKFRFTSDAARSIAETNLDAKYPQLRTSKTDNGSEFLLFVESKSSFIFDSLVEKLLLSYGGVRA